MTFSIELLKQQIETAKKEERDSAIMSSYIETNLKSLHEAISISSDQPGPALLAFVEGYIDLAPEYLQALNQLAKDAGISAYAQSFLNMAHTYFAKPPEVLETMEGLLGMLGRAYLCHRILEEVNDMVMSFSGTPMAPMDMSMANIVAHSLLSDDLANQLDHLVLLAIETSDADKTILDKPETQSFLAARKSDNWQALIKEWPCFKKNNEIDLQLNPAKL
jgi:hypothetical protein